MRRGRHAFALCLLLAGLSSACARRTFDAVVGADGGAPAPGDGGGARHDFETWPNPVSRANSDPWLVTHHDALRELRPRVLLLNFINDLPPDAVVEAAEAVAEGLAEGSRYHAYDDPSAPPFLRYSIARSVHLIDDPVPADWPHVSSSHVPLTDAGAFDVEALFGAAFASHYGFEDPAAPGRMLELCELFSGGHIHELWLAVADGSARHPPQALECKPRRAADGSIVAGSFVTTAGGDFCELAARCGVTVRIAHLNPMRGVGCDLDIRAWTLRGSTRAIPYLHDNARTFLNADLGERYGAPFDDFVELCDGVEQGCIDYPASDVAEGMMPDGTPWRFDPYEPGCGDPEYPPNARFQLDGANPQPVQTRCAHYGLGDGPDGEDRFELYSAETVAELTRRWGEDCAGGWQVYFRQSVPGLDNPARDIGGAPMKNWWVYSFY